MYLGENTVAGRIYDKIKRIVKDLRFDPDDEQERKKAKHLLTLRRYIQFSVMLTGFFLIMSAVNIYQKSWAMFQTTVLGAAITCVFAIVGGCKKKEGIVRAGICVCVIIMFSLYALTGGNDGFAIQRLEEKRNRTIEGTGLGLNLTKRLIEMMGGMLTVPCR